MINLPSLDCMCIVYYFVLIVQILVSIFIFYSAMLLFIVLIRTCYPLFKFKFILSCVYIWHCMGLNSFAGPTNYINN